MVDLGMEEDQSERKLPIPRLREALGKALPEALSLEKVDSFDSLLLCQLRENLNRSDAEDYLSSYGEEVAYGLPCDIREIKGEYFLFLPRVANWHYTRRLPVRGEHSPLNETYGFKHHVFVAILEKIAGVDHKTFFESYQPLEIGENFDSERTPYHRFYWTEKGAFLELYSQPTVAQAVKLNFMKERLSSLVPFKIEIVSSSSENKPLKAVESLAAEVRLPGVSVEAEFSACYGKAHEVALSPANKIEVISQSRGAPGSKLIFGFGYLPEQLQEMKEIPDEQWWLLFFFESVAAIHSQAKGSFILELIARKRYQKLRELSPRLVRDLTDFDIRKRMEAGFVSDASQILDDPLPCRREIIDDYLPFKVKLGGWEIPVGFRAIIDLEKESLLVDILARSEDYREPLKRTLLERMADKIAKQALSHIPIPIRLTNGEMLEIKNSSGKVIPISGYQK